MRSNNCRKILAAALVLTMTGLFANMPLLAAEPASFTGRVFQEDGLTPLPGVVVRLVDADNLASFDSEPTDAEGRFAIDSAPAGRYSLLAKDRDRVFLAAESLAVAAADNRPVSLALRPEANLAPAQAQKKGYPLWAKVTIAGGITIAGLFLINEVTEDAEEPSSPF